MLDNSLTTIRRVLVVQADPSAGEAINVLRCQHPDLSIVVLEVQEDNGASLSYTLHCDPPLAVYDQSQFETIQFIADLGVDAAVFFIPRERSPYVWAYRCYLAGVPIRIGLSHEFGGQVLSHEISPPELDLGNPHLYLLHRCGLLTAEAQTHERVEAFP